jgi:glucose-6-phosphate 1-dehydrogenase
MQQTKPKGLTIQELDELAINTIRTLSIDAVQQANSGHPGTPMALAPLVYVIWNEIMRFDPQDPIWPNRDRFVLSNGHASMLLAIMSDVSSYCLREVSPPITAAETIGVEQRGRFYEKTGALRDMVPNHLFQLLAMTAMEPPISFDADAVRAKKTEVIGAIKPLNSAQVFKDVVRGQYDGGRVLGKEVRPYRREPDVAPNSTTETYIAWKLNIDNWRWAGVPFYLRTGKSLKHRLTEIAIRFHQAPYSLFRGTDVERMHPNWMILRIQPDEGIALEFAAKRPGPTVALNTVSMDFAYKTYFNVASNIGYETLIYDCMIGDATLFQRADTVEHGWQAVQPILDAWANDPPRDFPNYVAGSDGPAAADELLARDGRAWRPLD